MVTKQLLTAEEVWDLPELPGVRYELVEGEVIEVPGASVLHSLIAALVYNLLRDTVRAGKLGFAFPDGVGYLIHRHPDTLRIPDASFISWARIPERKVPDGFWPVAPDLAVEVVSPFDRADEVHNKVHEYLEAGTQLVWILWPRRQSYARTCARPVFGWRHYPARIECTGRGVIRRRERMVLSVQNIFPA